MFGVIFYWMLNLSIFGSIAGLIVMSLGHIRKMPRFGIYLLWLLPLIRLWIPVGVANRYSLLNLLSQFYTKTIVVRDELPVLSMSNYIVAADSYFPLTFKTENLQNIFNTCGIIWLIVAVATIMYSTVLYVSDKSAIKNAILLENNIYRSDKIATPAIYGIIHPKIIIPLVLDCENIDLDYILMHERIHIRRHDNLWRVVAIFTACVHWFNPLVWIFIKRFFIDMELACDSAVLKKLSSEDYKSYARTLLAAETSRSEYYASAFHGTKTRQRIENILSYKRLTIASGLCFAVLIAFVAITVLTNATEG